MVIHSQISDFGFRISDFGFPNPQSAIRNPTIQPSRIMEDLKHSRKYRYLCDDTLVRIAAWAAVRAKSQKEATRRAKRKLHQVYGAYLEKWDFEHAECILDELRPDADSQAVRTVCRQIMQQHTSTKERVGLLEPLYTSIFAITGRPRRILDLGCGLHPFALPWMGLSRDVRYLAWDMDHRIVALVNRFLTIMGLEPHAQCRDMLVSSSTAQADVAFVLKMLPCLEQQEKGCSVRLLRDINAPFIVVSFPVHSIGGRGKGMRKHYAQIMEDILSELAWRSVPMEFQEELFFVLHRGRSEETENRNPLPQTAVRWDGLPSLR